MLWEYRVIAAHHLDGSEGERTLNEFGAEGWELVQQITREPLTRGLQPVQRWIFKRPLEEPFFPTT